MKNVEIAGHVEGYDIYIYTAMDIRKDWYTCCTDVEVLYVALNDRDMFILQ